MSIPYILTDKSLTVLHGGRSVAVPRSAENFDRVLAATQAGDAPALAEALDQKQAVVDFTSGRIEIRDRTLYYAGQPLDTSLTRKILEFKHAGDERLAQPLLSFLDKVMDNPSRRAVQGLYDWVSASGMPIHPDGDILAWKIVRDDYLDYHSGTLDHTPGNVVELPRNQCDEDPDQTCSFGIHFCSFAYLPKYFSGDATRRIMLVKINPRDVVAIPRDYGTAKGRCCRMEVLEQVPTPEEFFPTNTVYFDEREPEAKFEVGQRWRDKDGDVHTVTDVDEEFVTTEFNWETYLFELDGTNGDDPSLWLTELVEDTPTPEPEPEPETSSFLPLEVGKTYLTRDGQLTTVVRTGDYGGDNIVDTSMDKCLFAETGRANILAGPDRDYDIVAAFDPQVGERYERRDGNVDVVRGVSEAGASGKKAIWFVSGVGAVWASNGQTHYDIPSDYDLIRRVDTPEPIDWDKPLESVDGEARQLIEFKQTTNGLVAVVRHPHHVNGGGNYYDCVTGEHIFGRDPAIRNVA